MTRELLARAILQWRFTLNPTNLQAPCSLQSIARPSILCILKRKSGALPLRREHCPCGVLRFVSPGLPIAVDCL